MGVWIKQMILLNVSSFHSQGYLVVHQMPPFFFISKVYFYHEAWSFQSNLNSFTKNSTPKARIVTHFITKKRLANQNSAVLPIEVFLVQYCLILKVTERVESGHVHHLPQYVWPDKPRDVRLSDLFLKLLNSFAGLLPLTQLKQIRHTGFCITQLYYIDII